MGIAVGKTSTGVLPDVAPVPTTVELISVSRSLDEEGAAGTVGGSNRKAPIVGAGTDTGATVGAFAVVVVVVMGGLSREVVVSSPELPDVELLVVVGVDSCEVLVSSPELPELVLLAVVGVLSREEVVSSPESPELELLAVELVVSSPESSALELLLAVEPPATVPSRDEVRGGAKPKTKLPSAKRLPSSILQNRAEMATRISGLVAFVATVKIPPNSVLRVSSVVMIAWVFSSSQSTSCAFDPASSVPSP